MRKSRDKELISLSDEKELLTKEVTSSRGLALEASAELNQLEAKIIVAKDDLLTLTDKVEKAEHAWSLEKERTLDLGEAVNSLQRQVSELQDVKAQLKLDIAELNTELESKNARLGGLEATYTTKKTEKEAELLIIVDKLYAKTEELTKVEQIMDIERRDIASRQQALDERDKNLRLREAKARNDEESIRSNAGLLNL